jgi:predicted flap endonuclease-1-like 5' DNA nuclease
MLFTSVTQFAVLGLLLLTGWLFGLASHPGGKRWKRAYEDEAVGRAQDRDELDTQLRAQDRRIAELEQERAALEARIAEFDRAAPAAAVAAAPAVVAEPAADRVHVSQVTPETPAPVAVAAPPAPVEPASVLAQAPVEAPVIAHAAAHEDVAVAPAPAAVEHVEMAAPAPATDPLPIKRGWFDWGKGDDLTRLRGVDAELAERLKTENVDRFAELANLSDQEEIALERRLDLPAGYIMKEQLREQARLLVDGQEDEHAQRFG